MDCLDVDDMRGGLIVFSHAKTLGLCMALLFVVGFAATSQMAATKYADSESRAG